jgi:thiaminase/transcriptional activator TenA
VTRFSETLFERIEPIYQRILAHPFLTGLRDGSLDHAAFQFYVTQDSLYLKDFGRGLALLAAKSPTDDAVVMFSEHAKTAIVVERSLHEEFFKEWNISSSDAELTVKAPHTVLYTSYLLRVAYERPFHECLGAFLPCYWIYWEVGKELQRQGSPISIYQRWIDTYASEEFATVVKDVIALTDQIVEPLTPEDRERVEEHFVMTSRCEYLFWDMGYRRATWDI